MNLSEYISYNQSVQNTEKSTLWAGLTGALRESLGPVLPNADPHELQRAVESLDKLLHYGFYFDGSEESLNEKIAQVRAARKSVNRQIKQINVQINGEQENLGSYIFLESVGLFDEYLDLARTLRFAPDMSSARHFYYAHRLRETLTALGRDSVRILEIGAGAGNLSMLLLHYGLVKDYTIIDLPEMLLMSGVNLELRAGRECRFLEFPPAEGGRVAHYLVSANQDLAQLFDGIFDVVLNFNSFSEMPPSVVDGYFRTIYRTAKTGAVFMNVNRIQEHRQEDGRVFDMNPLLFPYAKADRILVWNADPFQQFVRQFCRLKAVKTTAIMRVATVHGGC